MPGQSDQFYLGYISMFAGTFAPRGWADCDGSLLNINSYPALYTVIGTTYGGDGITTFALPDFRTRIPIGYGEDLIQGKKGGTSSLTIPYAALPKHTHDVFTSNEKGTSPTGEGMMTAQAKSRKDVDIYISTEAVESNTMDAKTINPTGCGKPFDYMPPYTTIRYCICIDGKFPPRD